MDTNASAARIQGKRAQSWYLQLYNSRRPHQAVLRPQLRKWYEETRA